MSQLPVLAGLTRNLDWWDLPSVAVQLHPETTVLALATMLTLWQVGRRWPRLPAAIAAVLVGTLLYYLLLRYWPAQDLGALSLGAVVGAIPAAFPAPVYAGQIAAAALQPETWQSLWLVAPSIAVLAMLGALDSLMCAVAVGQLSGQRPEANRELLAQGASNLAGGLFGAVFGGTEVTKVVFARL